MRSTHNRHRWAAMINIWLLATSLCPPHRPSKAIRFLCGYLITGRRVEGNKTIRLSIVFNIHRPLFLLYTNWPNQKCWPYSTDAAHYIATLFTATGPITFRYVNRKPNDGLTMAIYTANDYKTLRGLLFALSLCPQSSVIVRLYKSHFNGYISPSCAWCVSMYYTVAPTNPEYLSNKIVWPKITANKIYKK